MCSKCDKSLVNVSYFLSDNKLLCEEHAGVLSRDMVCVSCQKPIESEVISNSIGTFHPKCFVCAMCGLKIEGKFIAIEDKPYCP